MSLNVKDNPPRSIDSEEKLETYLTLYDDITSYGVEISYQHRYALADLAVMQLDMEQLVREVEKGEVIEFITSQGVMEKKNPARTSLEKIRSQILALYREFKMTPVSSGAVSNGVAGTISRINQV